MDAPNFKGESCLHVCAQLNFPKTAEVLIEAKASIEMSSSTYITPLHVAARAGNYEVLDVLINHGANVNAKTKVSSFHSYLFFSFIICHDDYYCICMYLCT